MFLIFDDYDYVALETSRLLVGIGGAWLGAGVILEVILQPFHAAILPRHAVGPWAARQTDRSLEHDGQDVFDEMAVEKSRLTLSE